MPWQVAVFPKLPTAQHLQQLEEQGWEIKSIIPYTSQRAPTAKKPKGESSSKVFVYLRRNIVLSTDVPMPSVN